MIKQFLSRITFILFMTLSIGFLYGQNVFTACITQEGNLSFRIIKPGSSIYLSQKGKITSFEALSSGTISYDLNGRVDKIGTLVISYDINGRIQKIGDTNISYDINNRIDKIGTTSLSYDFNGNVDKIGGQSILYNLNGKVDKIGNASIGYNLNGSINKINDDGGLVIFTPKLGADK